MNGYFIAAGVGAVLLGIAHSVLGEVLLFKSGALAKDQPVLNGRRGAAIWSTWHLTTLFGLGLGFLFFWMAFASTEVSRLGTPIALFLFICAIFWAFGTRARHPAWGVFLALALLSYLCSA